ncbi:MAG: FKBP-type peptidyl-prolyl cis-trans isomerase [Bacteroidia bacterium]|nr:FKBP-type peptidyl-prolyl cis-trans isomerase [Bacteroidia bacterium]
MKTIQHTIFTGLIIFFIPGILFNDCTRQPEPKSDREMEAYKVPLLKVNKYLVQKDSREIENYIRQRSWDMKQSSTGLWYMIYRNGIGSRAEEGKYAKVNYTVSLLDGKVCYSTDSLGAESFIIGHSEVESGLDEGILMMKEGDKARFILPPHLAHGLLGDRKKIPPRSIIIYDVELLKVWDKK